MRTLLLALGLLLTSLGAATAHPHIFIDARATIVFNDAGELVAIRNDWTFDAAFSVWQIQGLDTDGDGVTSSAEMQDLADENIAGLAEYRFYTSAGEGAEALPFASADDQRFVFEDGRSTLSFSVEPQGPYRIRDELEIAIADPEYYVAISFAGSADVALENAPAGCAVRLEPPRDMPDDVAARLYSLGPDVTQLPPDLAAALRGVQGAIVVSCAGAPPVAATALDAVSEVAEAGPALPFGGPPPEPGLTLPRSGFFGWVQQLQSDFYQALTAALGRLKADGSAFWVLGGLSFLYGVFHAAGPGHGKVVISSYMLANEREVRRGVLLSFAAALMQSLVAVVFVGVAAALLGLSSVAMGTAVGWIEIGSYALIAGLGLWLVVRRLFGLGHAHAAVPALAGAGGGTPDAWGRSPGDPHHGHDHGPHGHDHGHGQHGHGHDHGEHRHHHVVGPESARGDWREQLGVVLAVGLRPCSGALVVLVFALSQGIFAAGVAATFLMGLGTAITVSVLAALAVGAKSLAGRLLATRGRLAGTILWWAELVGALAVFAFGAVLLAAAL